jgi:putative transposase
MRRSRFSETDILRVLNEHGGSCSIDEVSRNNGISQRTFYRWRARWGNEEVPAVEQLRLLVAENRRLRDLLAQPAHRLTYNGHCCEDK